MGRPEFTGKTHQDALQWMCTHTEHYTDDESLWLSDEVEVICMDQKAAMRVAEYLSENRGPVTIQEWFELYGAGRDSLGETTATLRMIQETYQMDTNELLDTALVLNNGTTWRGLVELFMEAKEPPTITLLLQVDEIMHHKGMEWDEYAGWALDRVRTELHYRFHQWLEDMRCMSACSDIGPALRLLQKQPADIAKLLLVLQPHLYPYTYLADDSPPDNPEYEQLREERGEVIPNEDVAAIQDDETSLIDGVEFI